MVETAPVADIFHRPLHPYTQGLISCLPRLGSSKETSELNPIPGRVPSPTNLPPGCLFEPRCPYAQDRCRQAHPQLLEFGGGHLARCILAEEIARQRSSEKASGPALGLIIDLSSKNHGSDLNIRNLRRIITEQFFLFRLVGLEKRHTRGWNQPWCRKTLGIVGESGCGKSTLAKTIVGLENTTAGEITFLNADLTLPLNKREITTIKELQMVFQNPDSVLNPSFSIGQQIARPLLRFNTVPRQEVPSACGGR
jgi:peptide/nickel transport system ATP-binding protein